MPNEEQMELADMPGVNKAAAKARISDLRNRIEHMRSEIAGMLDEIHELEDRFL